MSHGLPGMPKLAEHLTKAVKPEPSDASDWNKALQFLAAGDGIEEALSKVMASATLEGEVATRTWELMSEADLNVFSKRLAPQFNLPLARLLALLADTNHRNVHAITTNYDRIIEYAAEDQNILWNTGFRPGYKTRSWGGKKVSLTTSPDKRAEATVHILKVHGSLDWFKSAEGSLVSIPLREKIPVGFRPAIVTPGGRKYESSHYEPYRSAITESDILMKSAKAIMTIGFGFNDTHIQEKLNDRRSTNAKFLVLARTLTPSARSFLLSGHCRNYLALERKDDAKTNVYLGPKSAPIEVEGDLWSLEGFSSQLL